MEKDPRKLLFRATPLIFVFVVPLLYVDFMYVSVVRFDEWKKYTSHGSQGVSSGTDLKMKDINESHVKVNQDSMDVLLSRLVRGKDKKSLEADGFACNLEVHSTHCVANQPVQIDTSSMTVTIPLSRPVQETVIRPYARQEDETLLKTVTPVKILHGNITAPTCHYTHKTPAVIFSSSGFVGNIFHEINEILIPLFLTTKRFESHVQFVVVNHNPSFVRKFEPALSRLSAHAILNPALNQSVHCFPGGVFGLKFHGHLSVNSTDVPTGHSMSEFRHFLRESFGLKTRHVSQIKQPTVMLLSRRTTRRFLNEEEIVAMMEELGFRVVVVARAKTVSNLRLFASYINSCSVFVAAHGAGLTNQLFLPDGAVMVQVDLIGLAWAAATYYGDPARAMNVHYLRYRIEPEESSISKVYRSPDHVALRDFHWLSTEAGREVYLNGQNVRVNIARFRRTMVEALSLVQDSDL